MSAPTWISIDSRPPPRARAGRRLWVLFRMSDASERAGYVDEAGAARFAGSPTGDLVQLDLSLITPQAWRPFSQDALEAFEAATDEPQRSRT